VQKNVNNNFIFRIFYVLNYQKMNTFIKFHIQAYTYYVPAKLLREKLIEAFALYLDHVLNLNGFCY